MRILIAIIGILLFNFTYSQNREKYSEYVKKAWDLYESKDYEKSAIKYEEAFDQLEGKAYPKDRYRAACSYAMIKDIDNSFYHLFRLAESKVKYKNYNHITTDSDLEILQNDDRWEKLIEIIKANKNEYEKYFDKPTKAILDSIYILDQNYRKQISEIEKEYGYDSEEMTEHWKLISITDSMNLIKVKKILDKKGWLSPKFIGNQGNHTLFLVIQHSDLETQVKYLPMMQEAVKNGNAMPQNLALLEDRISIGQGKRQIYGSQLGRDKKTEEYYVYPLIEPENVNKRRAEVGLGTIEDYIGRRNMVWDLEKHKNRTKQFESNKDKK